MVTLYNVFSHHWPPCTSIFFWILPFFSVLTKDTGRFPLSIDVQSIGFVFSVLSNSFRQLVSVNLTFFPAQWSSCSLSLVITSFTLVYSRLRFSHRKIFHAWVSLSLSLSIYIYIYIHLVKRKGDLDL